MTTQTIQHYGPNGLISTETYTLTAAEDAIRSADINLNQIVSTLRQWSTDATNESSAWAGQTQAQRDAAMQTTFTRLGIFFNRFADLLTVLGRT